MKARKKFYCKDCKWRDERGLGVCFFGPHGTRTDICSSFRWEFEGVPGMVGVAPPVLRLEVFFKRESEEVKK